MFSFGHQSMGRLMTAGAELTSTWAAKHDTLVSGSPEQREKWVQSTKTASVPENIFIVNSKQCSGGHNVTIRSWCGRLAGPGSHQSHKCYMRIAHSSQQWRDSDQYVCEQMTRFYWLIPWEVFCWVERHLAADGNFRRRWDIWDNMNWNVQAGWEGGSSKLSLPLS